MTSIAEMTASFDWGVLLVADPESHEEIPAWASADALVSQSESALVVRVLHADDGPVRVRLSSSVADESLLTYFEGSLAIKSGVLRISNALGTQLVEASFRLGRYSVLVLANDPREPDEVNIVLKEA